MARHRAEILGPLHAARERIEAVLARSGNAPGTLNIAIGALDSIAHMEGLIASGRMGPSELAALANVLTTAQSTATALEAASSATADHAAEQLATASAEARTTARAVMAGMHDFDTQLRFASPDDQRDYREREAERRAYIARQPNTPVGNLNASGATLGQMADAKAHGAHGPEFDKRWKGLADSTERLREAVQRAGGSTREFDDRLRGELRGILKSKGLSDAEIDARFAANPDPLEAIKAYVQGDADTRALGNAVRDAAKADQVVATDTPVPVSPDAAADPIAKLRAAGLVAANHAADDGFSHGLIATARSAQKGPGVG